MIRYLIDADSSIYAMIDRDSPVNHRISEWEPGEVAISAISFAEIALGTQLQKPPPPEALEAFLAAIPLLPFDEGAARAYATLPFKRAPFDRLLAAHALSIGAVVVTNNEAGFADVPGLVVENWTI
ncbi:MAG: type II toxin-antitoxin system VapC family toxin [Novosphingobium sp.]